MKGGAHLSPLAALAYPNSKKYPFTAGLKKRIFQLSDGWRNPGVISSFLDILHNNVSTAPLRLLLDYNMTL